MANDKKYAGMEKKGTRSRIVFWGTSEFALPALEALFENGYEIAAVVTNPDEPKGRKGGLTPPPVKLLAQKYGIKVFQPRKLEIGNWKLEIPEADIFVVASYGKIIPKEILDIPKHGALNIHPSLLPRWRGPSPIQYTILNGDTETGVIIIQMDEKMDHGPILARREWEIRNPNIEIRNNAEIQNSRITYRELHNVLARLGAELLVEILPKWLVGEIKPIPQDESKATYCKILKKEDGAIDWTKSAEEIDRMIRAFTPWPGAYTFWDSSRGKERLIIEDAEPIVSDAGIEEPGRVRTGDHGLWVETGQGVLAIRQIRRAGGASVSGEDYLRGHRTILGVILGAKG